MPLWNKALEQYLLLMQHFPASDYIVEAHLRAAHCYAQMGSYRPARTMIYDLLAQAAHFETEHPELLSQARYRLGEYYAREALLEYAPLTDETLRDDLKVQEAN